MILALCNQRISCQHATRQEAYYARRIVVRQHINNIKSVIWDFFLENTRETKWWLQNYPVISAHSLSTYVSISLFIYFLSTNIPSLSLFTSYLPSLSPFIYPSLLSFFHLLDLQQFLRFDIPSMRMFVPRSFTHDKYPEWITVRGISFRSLACSVRSVDRQTMWCDYCRERNRA